MSEPVSYVKIRVRQEQNGGVDDQGHHWMTTAGPDALFECSVCGAAVRNTGRHSEWHWGLA